MDYTIVMPVFNKAGLTRQCLETIRPTLRGAGEGEILVIDNASSDETPEMLAEFPWVTVVRNDVNLGFSGANNQGARMARGEFLVLLNNDIVATPGWLAAMLARAREPGTGAVGAKLLFPSGAVQHAGVVTQPFRFGSAGFGAFHDLYNVPGNHPAVNRRAEFRAVTGACLVTPRALYEELGGLDEGFWNGYEDVDYCFKVAARGLKIVYEPAAVLTHFESQSGPQRFRKVSHNIARLNDRWNDAVVFDANVHRIARGAVRREVRYSQRVHTFDSIAIPETTVVLHGPLDLPQPAGLLENRSPVTRVVRASPAEAVDAIRDEMELRGDRYLAVVDVRATLRRGWLDELVRQVEFSWNVAASTYAGLETGEDVNPLAADARCTLLSLRQFPQHLRVGDFASADAAVADLLLRALPLRVATRGAGADLADLPALESDQAFERAWDMPLDRIASTDAAEIERLLVPPPTGEPPLVSVLMLSWNAPEYTRLALESIRAHTRAPYEVVIVDNGSGPETTDWLRTLEDVRVVYNPSNRGFAGGSNQAIAAARGDYVVLLNNDTVVTEGWLDGLLDAFARVPSLGVSAVRSNRVAGVQMVPDVPYKDIDGMHAYAAQRRRAYRRQGFVIDRAIGLCLCIPRHVIDEVGGIDERFGVGNFEDDDFCLRVRAAGYRIYVCDDVFIHHFGSKTFAANKIDYRATMTENWEKFASKWGLQKIEGVDGYDARPAYRGGFDRKRHFVALPLATPEAPPAPAAGLEREYATVFAGIVRDEDDWHEIGAFVRRYGQAFASSDPTLFAIAATGDLDATSLGERVRKTFEKQGQSDALSPDVLISDEPDLAAWLAALPGATTLQVGGAPELAAYPAPSERSPSALRRSYGAGARR